MIEFGKASDGALFIYTLGCEAARGKVGLVLKHGGIRPRINDTGNSLPANRGAGTT